jgi:hypothetical protein
VRKITYNFDKKRIRLVKSEKNEALNGWFEESSLQGVPSVASLLRDDSAVLILVGVNGSGIAAAVHPMFFPGGVVIPTEGRELFSTLNECLCAFTVGNPW